MSEFEDSLQDRQRVSSIFSSHSYRRNEYGSSPPTKGDFNSYSWGVHGRWESRSSVRGDKDSDSQSDWESDSGRHSGNQSQRSGQVPEHDGLLGSGSFPRSSGFAAGVSAPTFQADTHSQLNKSNEPYHPPWPYKAVPHSQRETNDFYNDETFGFSVNTSEDRAEEERKRRVSFEQMRREHTKAFQEKQKLNLDMRKDEFDITTLLEDSKDEKSLLNRSSVLNDAATLKASHNDSDRSLFPPQTPASRPLVVPPGFTSTVLKRNFGPKSVVQPHMVEHNNSKADEMSPRASQSSKFTRWFPEEEKKCVADLSSSRPNDLLSLIVSGEKGGSWVSSDMKNTEHVLSNFPFERFEPAVGHKKSNLTSGIFENYEQSCKNNEPLVLPAVLTCEDLEQSILSEISENGSTHKLPAQALSIPNPKTEPPSVTNDYRASQHLLSLLQKRTGLKDTVPSPNLDIPSEKLQNNEGASFDSAAQTKEVNAENCSSSGQTLSLETLFGTAFMKELQSVGAPLSVQRGSSGSAIVDVPESHEFPFPVMDDALGLTNELGSNTISYESSVLTSKQRMQTKLVKIDEQWFGFDDPQAKPGSFHPLDSHPANVNLQLKFMMSDEIIYHAPPLNHQFPANMLRPQFHDPSPGLTGFDPSSHHPMLQQMYTLGNFPPPHLLQGFPGNAPMLAQPDRVAPMPHASNQMTESMPEFNPLQAFPLGHQQPNFAGLGLPPPGGGGGRNHPEAIQRLIELELESK